MSQQAAGADGGSSARGDAAWKEALRNVSERNDAARKEGKARRAAFELRQNAARHAARDVRPSAKAKRRTP